MQSTPKELVAEAMAMGRPPRVPVMCQLAIGHTLVNTGVHPVDFFLSSEACAEALLAVRELYDFDGILIHKPGREPGFEKIIERIDRGMDPPTVYLSDGSKVECTRNDDPYYRAVEGFEVPAVRDIDPAQPLGWAPESFVEWCRHKGTAVFRSPEEIPEYWFGCIDRVISAAGDRYSVHGEVRSPFDHLLNIAGMQNGLIALLDCPEHVRDLMETFTDMAVAWAVAQVRRGCDAIKVSSPYGGAGFISRDQYIQWIVPFERRIADAVRSEGAVCYDHTCGAIGDRLDLMCEMDIHGIETLDPPPLGTVELSEAKHLLKDRLFIKGNVDPVNTVLKKSVEEARADIEKVYETGSPGGQYILSTACSVPPRAPPENVRQMAECVRAHSQA
ncbi:MAG: uroporphyrinogen decarboxylase family protein [Kiritimatiellia bacterium]